MTAFLWVGGITGRPRGREWLNRPSLILRKIIFPHPCRWMTMGSMLRLGLAGAAGKEGAMVRSMPREG